MIFVLRYLDVHDEKKGINKSIYIGGRRMNSFKIKLLNYFDLINSVQGQNNNTNGYLMHTYTIVTS